MGSRRQASLAANPLLVGAVTTLVVAVAVYLSYNANNGLPFVPTYNLKATLPDANGLFEGNDVRIGGTRVGLVTGIVPHQEARTGRTVAIVEMKLQKSVQPLPQNTEVSVLSRSSVGLKYLALIKGTSSVALKPGATIPITHYREPVELDEFFGMFDKPTRIASQEDLINGGNGFAGRGEGLNRTIHELRPLTAEAIPVLRNLAAPRTGFGELWRDLDKPAAQTAPVATQEAAFFVDLDTFFRAWASVSTSLERSIEGGPPSLRQAIYSLPHEAPFVEKSAQFMRLLRPSAVALRGAAPAFADAVEEGVRTLPAAAGLNERLKTFLANLRAFAEEPAVETALETLTRTAGLGSTVVGGIAPEQVNCNYVTLTFRNLASLLATDIGVGTVARVETILAPSGPNAEGAPASVPAHGPSPELKFGPQYNNNFLHANPYPNVTGPSQPAKLCEAANEEYEAGKTVIGHARKVTAGLETTKRKTSLLNETYLPATLEALGIGTSKKGKGK
ncbi:MAG: MlaD family protein [Solirubrobacteraceae bacterium]